MKAAKTWINYLQIYAQWHTYKKERRKEGKEGWGWKDEGKERGEKR